MSNTYTKLRDGSWGVRVQGQTSPGATVTVTKRSGETKTETIDKVLWTGGGVSLCSVRPNGAASSSSKGRSHSSNGCSRCCQTATRRAQIWEECEYCGAEPIYV